MFILGCFVDVSGKGYLVEVTPTFEMPEVTPPLKSALEGVTTLKLLVYSNYPKASARKFSAYVRLASIQSDVSIHENPSNTKSSGVEIPMMCCRLVEHYLFS